MSPVTKALKAVLSFVLLVVCTFVSSIGAVMIVAGVGFQRLVGQDRSRTHSATREWHTYGPDNKSRYHYLEVSMENGPAGVKHLVDGTMSKLFEQAEHEINEELKAEKEEASSTREDAEEESEPAGISFYESEKDTEVVREDSF